LPSVSEFGVDFRQPTNIQGFVRAMAALSTDHIPDGGVVPT
jgi:hypothetical protein